MLGHAGVPPTEGIVQRWYTAKKPLPKKSGKEQKAKSRKQSLNPLTMFGLGLFHRQIFFEKPSPPQPRNMYTDWDVGTGLFGVTGPGRDHNRDREEYTKDGVRGDDDDRMRRAVNDLIWSGEWQDYNLLTHNCQHFVKAALKKRQELEKQDRGVEGEKNR